MTLTTQAHSRTAVEWQILQPYFLRILMRSEVCSSNESRKVCFLLALFFNLSPRATSTKSSTYWCVSLQLALNSLPSSIQYTSFTLARFANHFEYMSKAFQKRTSRGTSPVDDLAMSSSRLVSSELTDLPNKNSVAESSVSLKKRGCRSTYAVQPELFSPSALIIC